MNRLFNPIVLVKMLIITLMTCYSTVFVGAYWQTGGVVIAPADTIKESDISIGEWIFGTIIPW